MYSKSFFVKDVRGRGFGIDFTEYGSLFDEQRNSELDKTGWGSRNKS